MQTATAEDRARRHWPPQYGNPHAGGHSLWLKGDEAALMKRGLLTVIVRLGDRGSAALTPLQYLHMFEPVAVYYIAVAGDQAQNIAPVFEQDDGKTIMIARRVVTRLGYVRDDDLVFEGGRSVARTIDGLADYIGRELAPGTMVGPETPITLYHVCHLA